jgi:hypothetical protein
MSFITRIEISHRLIQRAIVVNNKKFEEIEKDVIGLVVRDIRTRFLLAPLTQTGGYVLGGVYWRPVQPEYLYKRPERKGGKLLVDTGRLKDTLTNTANAQFYAKLDGAGLVIGSDLAYAGYQHNMRPIVFQHKNLTESIYKLFESYNKS